MKVEEFIFQRDKTTGGNSGHDAIIILILWSLVIPITSSQTQFNDTQGTFMVIKDTMFYGHLIESLTTHEVIECFMSCAENTHCLSVNYISSVDDNMVHQCELNSARADGIQTLIRHPGSTYSAIVKDEPMVSPCLNKGEWIQDKNDTSKLYCNCTAAYTGEYCENFRPRSCSHVQENGTKQDGEYDLFLMGSGDERTAKIYCAEMSSNTPLEYVTLTAGKDRNFAKHYQHQTRRLEITYFSKVRISLSDMALVINDYRFATSNVADVFRKFATAGDCQSSSCYASSRYGSFLVDFSGTSFRLPPSISYSFYNYPSCTAKLFSSNMATDRRVWSAKCGGYCGSCTPKGINLEFVG